MRKRTPRLVAAAAVVSVATVTALLVASSAVGRSQAAPTNTKEPFVTYVYPIKVGTILTGNRGSWNGANSFVYHWGRCNDNGEACTKINNATSLVYTVVNADEGHTLRLRVTASNADGDTTAVANATSEVPIKPGAPVELSPPAISGQAVVGETLTATTGKWKGNQPISYTFKWQSCTPNLSSCPANGANGNTYTVKGADTGKRLRVKVIAKNNAGQTAALSDPTAKVTEAGGGGGGGGSSVPASSLVAGDRLIVDTVHFSPNPVTSRSTPITVQITVKDNKGKFVRGALVSMVSTPVVTSSPTPAETDSNGSVAYTVQPESDFPIKNGYSVQFYVKAYRAGDPTLGGVAGARLVQVGTRVP
jgi:hypothetical protein